MDFNYLLKEGTATQTKMEPCFVSYLKLTNTALKHPEANCLRNSIKISVGQVVLELLIKTCR